MKQKRKVKSLIPQKNDWRSSFLTAILLILSVALCIGSASLITSTVRAAEPGVIASFTYTGLDENQEVLYGMRFVDRDDISEPVNYIYIKGKSLYITPNPVIVNPMTDLGNEIDTTNVNEVEPGVYGHVLGGYKNEVKSDNVTLIAGEENVVPENNDNAVLLGGKYNNDFGPMREGGTPMVVVGGSNNSIGDGHDGVALIGGQNNRVGKSVSNAFILGGERNEIKDNRSNVIIGGKNVVVDEDNVFVYSSDDNGFEPDNSNAFYLNVKKGVGINTASSDRGLAVKGAVNLGEININLQSCADDNFGVIGNYDGCVVGCTKAGKNAIPNGKWEMLDRGEHCQTVCSNNPNHCIYTGDYIVPEPDYNSFCTTGVVDTGHAELCFPDSLAEHKNSVFETVLVDYEDCPSPEEENKCVYQCKDGYHLAKDTTSSPSLGTKCFADCNLAEKLKDPSGNSDWYDNNGKPIIIKHNEVKTGYNKSVVDCAGYRASNPSGYPSGYGTYLDNGFGTKRPNRPNKIGSTTIGVPFGLIQNKNPDKLPEHCGNNAHKQELVCVNGEVYISRGGKSTGIKATQNGTLGDNYLGYAHNGYVYQHCDTKNYRCDGSYNLTKDIITMSFEEGGFADSGDGWNNIQDRGKFRLKRGTYKLCLDYNRVEGNNEACEIVDKLSPHVNHYKFVECNHDNDNGYYEYTDEDGVVRCKEQCKVTAKNAEGQRETITVKHKEKYEFYLSGSATCTGVCESQRFECNDGTFYATGGANNGRKREDLSYKYSECALYDNKCSRDEYNVTASQFEQWKSRGEYVSCDDYLNIDTRTPRTPPRNPTKDTRYNKQCRKDETNYKLVRCYPGYHTEDGKFCAENVKDMPCPLNPNNSHWVRTSALTSYPYSSIITNYKTYLESGKYLKWWDENCEWNDPISCWIDELQSENNGKVIPGDACEWECDTGYIRNGNVCEHIDTTCKYPDGCDYSGEPYACVDSNAKVENKRLEGGAWKWNCVNGLTSETKSCLWCDNGYHLEGSSCVANVDAICDNENYGCEKGIKSNRNGIYERYDGTQVLLGYTYDCLGVDGPNGTSDELYMCPEASNVSCQYCVFGQNSNGTCKEPLCGVGDNPLTSSNGIILGKDWYPNMTWNPKVWTYRDYASYDSSSNYCLWTCNDSIGYEKYGRGCRLKTYTITYNGNGGTPDRASDSVTHGDYVDLPGATRDCHSFDYWMEGSSRQWSPYGPVYADATLTAHWTEDEFTVEYRNNGHGIAPASQTMKYSTETKVRNGITANDGYKFVNWCTAGGTCYNPGDVINATNACPTQDLVLYAQWTENTALLTYNANGFGTAPDPVNLYYGTKATAADAIAGDINHAFIEWCKQGGSCYDPGDTVKDANVEPVDITLYAQWVKCQGSFENARQIKGIGTSTSNLTSTLWDTESEANSHSCSWVCKSGFKPNAAGTRCEVINYSCGRSLETVNKCFDGSNYVAGTSTSHSQNEYNRYCGDLECGLCDENSHISGQRPDTLHAGLCEDSNPKPECNSPWYRKVHAVYDNYSSCSGYPQCSDLTPGSVKPSAGASSSNLCTSAGYGTICCNGANEQLRCSCIEDVDGKCGSQYLNCAKGSVNNSLVVGNQTSVRDSGTKGWKWDCKGKGNGTTATCTAILECDGTSVNPSCKGSCGSSQCPDSYCDASQKPLNGCKVDNEPQNGSCGLVAGTCSSGNPTDVTEVNNGTAKQWSCEGIGGGTSIGCSLNHLIEGGGCTSTTSCDVAYNGPTACTSKLSKETCEDVGAYLATPTNGFGTNTYFPCPLNQPFVAPSGYTIATGCGRCCSWGDGTEKCMLNGVVISNSYCDGLN